MSQQPILKNFVSEIDQFLQDFDKKNTKQSVSQQKEQAKYSRIYKLRDVANPQDDTQKTLWEGF